MSNQLIYGVILGFTFGILFGYLMKHFQDDKYLNEITEIKDKCYSNMKSSFIMREELYKEEINRLHATLAKQSVAECDDLYKMALEKEGFKELEFPNGGLKNEKK